MPTGAVLSFTRAQRTARAHPVPKSVFAEPVQTVEHYAGGLARLRVRRPVGLGFRSGEFVMIGLPGAPMRAYSIASPNWDSALEFVAIPASGGALSERLTHLSPGDIVLLDREATGTLVNDALEPGERLFLFASGTGIAPFASLIRDPETYDKFDSVILSHACHSAADLHYAREVVAEAMADPLMGEFIAERLVLFTSHTGEPHAHAERICNFVRKNLLDDALAMAPLHPNGDRVMVCSSQPMLEEAKAILADTGFAEGSRQRPASYVVQRAFPG